MANDKRSPSITNGFHLMLETMQYNGLDTIYGVARIQVTDLVRLAQAMGMRHIGFRHEQSAGSARRMEIGGFNV
jgi:oxalyl-CoA decarboxylase